MSAPMINSSRHDILTDFQKCCQKIPDAPLYTFVDKNGQDEESLTYGQTLAEAQCVAGFLTEKCQLKPGDHVLLVYTPSMDFVKSFIACLLARIIPVPMAPPNPFQWRKNENLFATIAQNAEAKAVLSNREYMLAKKWGLLKTAWKAKKKNLPSLPWYDTSLVKTKQYSPPSYIKPQLNDLAFLQYTSGSTSAPKGVMISFANIEHQLACNSEELGLSIQSKSVLWVPHYHDFGLISGILSALSGNGHLYLMSPLTFLKQPELWCEVMSRVKATHTAAPNFAYELLLRKTSHEQRQKWNLSSLKVMMSAAEPIRYNCMKQFLDDFSVCQLSPESFCPAYGLAEHSVGVSVRGREIVHINRLLSEKKREIEFVTENSENKKTLVGCGSPSKGVEVRIVNPETRETLPEKKVGEIWVNSPSKSEGYFNLSEETGELLHAQIINENNSSEYLRTGDLGFLHKGEIFIVGRLKDVMIMRGRNIHLEDIEESVRFSHPAIRPGGVVAFGIEGEVDEVELLIVVVEVRKKLKENILDDIAKTIRKVIYSNYQVSCHAIVIGLPGTVLKTTSGKVTRQLNRQFFVQGKTTIKASTLEVFYKERENSEQNGSISSELISELRAKICHDLALEIEKISSFRGKILAEDDFSRYGFDSATLVEFSELINNKYNLSLTPDLFFEYSSLSSLSDYLIEDFPQLLSAYYTMDFCPGGKEEKKLDQNISSSKEKDKPFHKANEDIAIIGIACRFPGSPDLKSFWSNLEQEKDLVREIPKERWEWRDFDGDACKEKNKTRVKWGGFIDDIDKFDASFFKISPREAQQMDPQHRIFLETAWQVIENAGYRASDLEKYKTGLFVGASTHDYLELLRSAEINEAHSTTGVAHSVLANRVSYLLNLTGPSESIDTACSSSLVAIHHAIRAIECNDCEMAIAGGVNALLTPLLFVSFDKAGMLSEDGRCKTFDKNANGYVRGEGVGALLLKRLSQAQTDGDHIYAVIKACAVNHGGNVNTLTAPNPDAQAKLLVEAYQRAQIDIDQVGYIEAHGTGTSLGDPIEIRGLKKAFTQLRKEQGKASLPEAYCGLSSVKTNIGHLEAAAGIAGIIKVVLAMKHRKLPGTVHFKEKNPYIKLENSPFFIVKKTQEWATKQTRFAGVSSFGFGGSNAHVVLEEYHERKEQYSSGEDSHWAILSAKSKETLQKYIENFQDYLKEEASVSLKEIAYTLQTGREAMKVRLAIEAKSKEELSQKLHLYLKKQEVDGLYWGEIKEKKTSFMEDEDAREMLVKWLEKKKLKKLIELWIEGVDIPWKLLDRGSLVKKVPLPTYPFSPQRYWIPESLSFGFDSSEKKRTLHSLIDENVSDLKKVKFSKMLTGEEFYLKDHKIGTEHLLPGVVSLEMARAAAYLAGAQRVSKLQNIVWAQPVSKSSSKQLMSIELAETNGLVEYKIYSESNREKSLHTQGHVIYETEPEARTGETFSGEGLANKASYHYEKKEIYEILAEEQFYYGENFQSIQWLKGNSEEVLAKLSLPPSVEKRYEDCLLSPSLLDGALQTVTSLLKQSEEELSTALPFEIKELEIFQAIPKDCYVYTKKSQRNREEKKGISRYDIQITDLEGKVVVHIKDFSIRRGKLAKINSLAYYKETWEPSPTEAFSSAIKRILIFGEDEKKISLLQKYCRENNIDVLHVSEGENYSKLFDSFRAQGIFPEHFIYLGNSGQEDLKTRVHNEITKLFFLHKALFENKGKEKIKFMYLCFDSLDSDVFLRSTLGFMKSLKWENSKYQGQLLSLSQEYEEKEDLARVILSELGNFSEEVRHTQEQRWIKKLYSIDTPKSSMKLVERGKTYIISGGAGGLGQVFSQYFAQAKARLVLVGRSPFTKKIQKQIDSIKELGGEAFYFQADITNFEEVQDLIQKCKNQFGQVNGVLHSAGLTQDTLFSKKTKESFFEVVSPKVSGTVYLDKATAEENLDFFIMFSSVSSKLGNLGQSDYAFANGFMDGYAQVREELRNKGERQGKTFVFNWPLWESKGMKVDKSTLQWIEQNTGMSLLPQKQGLEVFERCLAGKETNLLVLIGNQDKIRNTLETRREKNPDSILKQIRLEGKIKEEDSGSLKEKIQAYLVGKVEQALQVDKENIDLEEDLSEYGFDSILLTEFINGINEEYQLELLPTVLFEYPSILEFSEYLVKHYEQKLAIFYPETTSPRKNIAEKIRVEKDFSTEELAQDAFLDFSISKPVSRKEPSFRNIFLTGATGFLGAFLLYELLEKTSADIHCLVRSQKNMEGKERVIQNLHFYSLWKERFRDRIFALDGDLSKPRLGLGESDFVALSQKLDVIYHNGAIINFVYPYQKLKKTNVQGTHEVIRLASLEMIPLHHISSISVFPFDSPYLIKEDMDISQVKKLLGGYAQSKWVAEKMLNHAKEQGLPVSIYRPGIISGDTLEGKCNLDDYMCRLIKGSIQLKKIVRFDNSINVIPVDYVAKAIIHISQLDSPSSCFNIVNTSPMEFDTFFQWICDYGYFLEETNYEKWQEELSYATKSKKQNALTTLLGFFAKRSIQALRMPKFDQRNTLACIENISLSCPPVDGDLMTKYFAYFIEEGFLEKPPANEHLVEQFQKNIHNRKG